MRLVDTEDVVDALGNMGEEIDLKEAEEWIDTVPTAMQLWTSVKKSTAARRWRLFRCL